MRRALRLATAPFAPGAPAVAWAAFAAVVALAAGGCRRDAPHLLQRESLFPDAGTPPLATPPPSASGTLARAELVREQEPNDRPEEAQPVSSSALVEGSLSAVTAGRAPKPRKPRGGSALDSDWYRLAATPPGQLVQVDLRSGPPCAQLELYDDTGKTLITKAKSRGGVRPVLPSIGPDAHASLVRVVCEEGGEGAYKLAIFTRPARPDEELEPNDTARRTLQVLRPGQSLQGTLAPDGDVDSFLLDLGAVGPVDVWVLSVTPVAGVTMELALLDPGTQQPVLVRRAVADTALVIPDLAASRLPKRLLLQLRAVAGQAPDQPWVLTLAPLLPAGCVKQADCLDRLPTEREPNDLRLLAPQAALGQTQSGFLDGPSDVDAVELTCPPGTVVRLVATPPADVTLHLQVGDGPDKLDVVGAGPGLQTVIAGVLAATGRLGVILQPRADAAHAGTLHSSEPWRLESSAVAAQQFEQEAGNETRLGGVWTPAHALLPLPPDPSTPVAAWRRTGALVPAGDVDTFGLDLSARAGPTGGELQCGGDGAPGLTCRMLDGHGAEIALLRAGDGERPSTALLTLQPGRYRLIVAAESPRLSPQLYRVGLREAPEVLAMPVTATPVE